MWCRVSCFQPLLVSTTFFFRQWPLFCPKQYNALDIRPQSHIKRDSLFYMNHGTSTRRWLGLLFSCAKFLHLIIYKKGGDVKWQLFSKRSVLQCKNFYSVLEQGSPEIGCHITCVFQKGRRIAMYVKTSHIDPVLTLKSIFQIQFQVTISCEAQNHSKFRL